MHSFQLSLCFSLMWSATFVLFWLRFLSLSKGHFLIELCQFLPSVALFGSAPIFQPFLGRLIATNVELPCSERNVVEIMRFVYTYTAQLILGVYYFPIFTHYAVSNFVGFPPWGSWL